MNRNEILKRAKQAAAINKKNRKDPRYVKVMGFLIAKGFLHTNQDLPLLPNARLMVEDALWAGRNVEPRILEVLPAAVIRMGTHFNFDPERHIDLAQVIDLLKAGGKGAFLKIPLEKIEPWLNIRLKDGRTKVLQEKKIMKTFRLSPDTLAKIRAIKKATHKTETEIIEKLVAAYIPE